MKPVNKIYINYTMGIIFFLSGQGYTLDANLKQIYSKQSSTAYVQERITKSAKLTGKEYTVNNNELALAEPGTSNVKRNQWTNIGPGGGGWFRCIEFSTFEKKIFIGGDVSGIFISSNDYTNFKPSNTNLKNNYVNSIYFHPYDKKIIYLGTKGGVAKSSDSGETWEMLRNGFRPVQTYGHSASVYAMAISSKNPDVVFAGLGQERNFGKNENQEDIFGLLYKSKNGGKSWTEISIDKIQKNESIMSIFIDPKNDKSMYLLSQTMLFFSTNGGDTWTELSSLPFHDCIYTCLVINKNNPKNLLISYKKDNITGIIRSDNNGKNWHETSLIFNNSGRGGINRIKSHPKKTNVFFANFNIAKKREEGGVYITTDSGSTWKKINRSKNMDVRLWSGWDERSTDFAIDPKNPDVMSYVNDMEVYMSYDAGNIWNQIASQRISDTKSGQPDLWKNSGLDILCPRSIAVNPQNSKIIYLGYMDVGLFKTEDGGNSLYRITSGIGNAFACCNIITPDPENPDGIYIAYGMNRNRQSIYKSTDGGNLFKQVGIEKNGFNDKGYISFITIDPKSKASNRTIYAGVIQYYKEDKSRWESGIFKSIDNGNSWNSINNGLPLDSMAITDLKLHPSDSNIIYICSQFDMRSGKRRNGYVAKSINGGKEWKVILSEKLDLRCISIDPFNPNIIYAGNRDYSGFQQNKIFWKSTDGGKSWVSIQGDFFNKGLVYFNGDKGNRYFPTSIVPDPAIKGRIYISFRDDGSEYNNRGGVFFSNDYGETWDLLDLTGIPNLSINSIYISSDKTLYLLTDGNGIWRKRMQN